MVSSILPKNESWENFMYWRLSQGSFFLGNWGHHYLLLKLSVLFSSARTKYSPNEDINENMLRLHLEIWKWEWVFGRAVKAISSLGIRSLWSMAIEPLAILEHSKGKYVNAKDPTIFLCQHWDWKLHNWGLTAMQARRRRLNYSLVVMK